MLQIRRMSKNQVSFPFFKSSASEWKYHLGKTLHIWFEGQHHTKWSSWSKNLPKPEVILVRKDLWRIGCLRKDLDKLFALYDTEWVCAFEPIEGNKTN